MNEAKQAGDTDRERKAYTRLGLAYHNLGDYRKAIEFHQQSLSIAKEVGNKGSEGKAYTNLGRVYHRLGDYKSAIEFHQQSLTIEKRLKIKLQQGQHMPTLAMRITVSVIMKKQSNFISSLLVSQKRLEKRFRTKGIQKSWS